MKAFILAVIIGLGFAGTALADVIRLEDGAVYLGKMVSAEGGVVSIEAFGKTVQVASSQIMKTEVDYKALYEQPVEVILIDASVIRGKIRNFDEDVGLLIELGIGELTVPLENLRAIEDPIQRARHGGFPFQVGLTGGYFIPAGAIASPFSSGFTASLSVGLSLPFLQGLTAGLDITQFFVSYIPSGDLSYSITTATIGPFYRLLFFRTSQAPILRDLVPWLGLGAGIAYVHVNNQSNGSALGEVDPVYCASIGLDFHIVERIVIRLNIRWLAVQQTTQLLHLPSAGIGVAASF